MAKAPLLYLLLTHDMLSVNIHPELREKLSIAIRLASFDEAMKGQIFNNDGSSSHDCFNSHDTVPELFSRLRSCENWSRAVDRSYYSREDNWNDESSVADDSDRDVATSDEEDNLELAGLLDNY